jgi:type I restriction enzyme R subunit
MGRAPYLRSAVYAQSRPGGNPHLDKKDLTEQEIRTRYITPAIQGAGWLPRQIREEVYLTAGQIHPRGRVAPRGRRKFADYVLYHHNLPLAIVEAKDNNHPLGGGCCRRC